MNWLAAIPLALLAAFVTLLAALAVITLYDTPSDRYALFTMLVTALAVFLWYLTMRLAI